MKAILFDADGVLIHSELFSIQYQKKFNVSNDEMLPFFTGEFQDCLVGKANLIELVKPWLSKWKWEGSVEEFLEFWFQAEHNVDEDVVKTIKELKKKGIKCYLATNQERYRTEYMKDKMGFNELFDEVFSSAYIGHKKPHREFFEFILKEIDLPADEIMFFDDEQGHIDAAKELGIDAHVYEDINKLRSIVEKKTEYNYFRNI